VYNTAPVKKNVPGEFITVKTVFIKEFSHVKGFHLCEGSSDIHYQQEKRKHSANAP